MVEIIREIFSDVMAIYIFGSYGTEFENEKSDIDIAVLLENNFPSDEYDLKVKDCILRLNIKYGREIDLINIRKVSTVFMYDIIMNGKLIFRIKDSKVDEFEMYVISKYQKLNEERADIINNIKKTGKILL